MRNFVARKEFLGKKPVLKYSFQNPSAKPPVSCTSRKNHVMNPFFHSLRLLFPAILLTACTPARTGVIGNTLTTNVSPRISITAQPPWTVTAHGRFSPYSGRTTSIDRAILEYNYAFFTDTENDDDRFAYAGIVRLEHNSMWRFQPPTRFDDAFMDSSATLGGIHWSVQLLRIAKAEDWPGAVWKDSGKPLPSAWLAKRWIAHLDDKTRAIMEYREAWPGDIPMLASAMPILNDSAAAALQQFNERADAVFLVTKKAGDFTGQPAPNAGRRSFRIQPDMPKLLGEVLAIHDN